VTPAGATAIGHLITKTDKTLRFSIGGQRVEVRGEYLPREPGIIKYFVVAPKEVRIDKV